LIVLKSIFQFKIRVCPEAGLKLFSQIIFAYNDPKTNNWEQA